MTDTANRIARATLDWFTALKGRGWDNPNYSESYKKTQREATLKPFRDIVDGLVAQARANAAKATELTDPSGLIDSQGDMARITARELAWQRLEPAVRDHNVSLFEQLAAGATALELEALHMGLKSLVSITFGDQAARRDLADMLEMTDAAYATSDGVPGPLREAAETLADTTTDLAVADVAETIVAGKGLSPATADLWNRMLDKGGDAGHTLWNAFGDGQLDAALAAA